MQFHEAGALEEHCGSVFKMNDEGQELSVMVASHGYVNISVDGNSVAITSIELDEIIEWYTGSPPAKGKE